MYVFSPLLEMSIGQGHCFPPRPTPPFFLLETRLSVPQGKTQLAWGGGVRGGKRQGLWAKVSSSL